MIVILNIWSLEFEYIIVDSEGTIRDIYIILTTMTELRGLYWTFLREPQAAK